MHTGRCHCGQVAFAVEGRLADACCCHCPTCQRLTGSAFGAYAGAPKAAFRWTHGEEQLTRYAATNRLEKFFCAQCGSVLLTLHRAVPGSAFVSLGTLDDPGDVRLQYHQFVGEKAPWHRIGDGLPRHPGWPVPEEPHALIRSFSAEEWRAYRELRLRSLEESPDAFGSTLAQEGGRADSEWRARLGAGVASENDLPLVAELEGEPVGLAWGRIDPDEPEVVNLYQMWVAPEARRTGTGARLLEVAVGWARQTQARELVLAVSLTNPAARRLYERAGFEPVAEPEPLRPGSTEREQRMRILLRSPSGP